MQDVTFHQCVNLGRFNAEKVVGFVPPDGEVRVHACECMHTRMRGCVFACMSP